VSNPGRVITKQLKRSGKDISDEWKRVDEGVRNVVTVQAVIAATLLTAGAAAGPAAAAGGAGGAGAAAGIGSIPGAASAGMSGGGALLSAANAGAAGTAAAGAAGGGGFLAGIGSSIAGGASSVGSAIGGANPLVQAAMLQTGGQMLAGAMAPEPERQVDVLREQQRIASQRGMPSLGGGYLGASPPMPAGSQPSGAVTTPQPSPEPLRFASTYSDSGTEMPMPNDTVGRFNPRTFRWENAS